MPLAFTASAVETLTPVPLIAHRASSATSVMRPTRSVCQLCSRLMASVAVPATLELPLAPLVALASN